MYAVQKISNVVHNGPSRRPSMYGEAVDDGGGAVVSAKKSTPDSRSAARRVRLNSARVQQVPTRRRRIKNGKPRAWFKPDQALLGKTMGSWHKFSDSSLQKLAMNLALGPTTVRSCFAAVNWFEIRRSESYIGHKRRAAPHEL